VNNTVAMSFKLVHQTLNVAVSMQARLITGETEMILQPFEELSTIAINARQQVQISSVRVENTEAQFHRSTVIHKAPHPSQVDYNATVLRNTIEGNLHGVDEGDLFIDIPRDVVFSPTGAEDGSQVDIKVLI
jgi:hypothetical protein